VDAEGGRTAGALRLCVAAHRRSSVQVVEAGLDVSKGCAKRFYSALYGTWSSKRQVLHNNSTECRILIHTLNGFDQTHNISRPLHLTPVSVVNVHH
jgi:hypothetical protein